MHEHFDAAGVLTGTTVVTRESPWDDDSRGRALRLAEYTDSLCGCGCGLPITESRDATRAMFVESHVCYARRAIESVSRADEKAARKADKPDGWADGVIYTVVPLDPNEDKGADT